MTVLPQPQAESTGLTCTYDGWSRLVKVANGVATVAEYQYDGNHRRIAKLELVVSSPDTWTRTDYYYNSSWQLLQEDREEGFALASKPTNPVADIYGQYIWSRVNRDGYHL